MAFSVAFKKKYPTPFLASANDFPPSVNKKQWNLQLNLQWNCRNKTYRLLSVSRERV
jgi:hypothetical protein